jgi:hypothetical protein
VRRRTPSRTSPQTKPLDKRVEVHDRHQFELKLEYMPPPGERLARYVVEMFVCAPVTLNVTGEVFGKEAVYADIHNYVRLKTPELGWSELREGADSPLRRVAAGFETFGADETRLVYECKLFGCVFRAGVRDLVEACLSADDPMKIGALLEPGLAGMRAVLDDWRALAPRAAAPSVTERPRAAYRLADEYASLCVEQQLRKVLVRLARDRAETPWTERLLDQILTEERYRRACDYASTIDPDTDNEAYLYRVGLLKKYCQSALFLRVKRYAARRQWLEVFYAVAAGLSMAFATVIAFWAQRRWPAASLNVFLILVVAYMFKDRLKEGTRGFFAGVLDRRMYDRKIVISDQFGEEVGYCQEKVAFLSEAHLPSDVHAIRLASYDPSLRVAESELEETVIHYRKQVVLPRAALGHRKDPSAGVTDIIRFHIGRFLHDMDEPAQEIDYMDENTHELRPVRAAKVYHVDVVFRFTEREGEVAPTKLMRLVLDREGIKRVETKDAGVSTVAQPDPTDPAHPSV